ncbi:MAG: ATP-binding protein [Canidatus Methanoxibalbensis ujae]|nr:ATP-binding protein [Candidatus Methanoxibalbensis ujae]
MLKKWKKHNNDEKKGTAPKRGFKFFTLLSLILLCISLSIFFVLMHKTIIYTHFFYIPIILAAIWYKKRAIYIAILLGVMHIFFSILVTSPTLEIFMESMGRASMLFIVAYAIGLMSQRCKDAREEMKSAKERYHAIFEHALTALCVVDSDGKILLANRQFEELVGLQAENLRGRHWTDFVAEEDAERARDYCESRWKGGAPACSLFKFINSKGERKYVNACMEPIPNSKECIISLLDITELKNREEELRKTCKKLEELDKMKRDFLNVAYHEMRSPLAPIVGYASMLEMCAHTEKERKYVRSIERCARQLEKMINRMLELARIDGEAVKLSIERASVRKIVEQAVATLLTEAREKRHKISLSVPDVEIECDKQKIMEVFTNLISNAIKYTEEGGRIEVVVEDRGEDIKCCVSDTGMGIPKEHLPKIFERFYVVDTSLTRKSGSLGLGLSIVKEYVRMHGGKVWAISEVGKGSKFFFTLPKRQEEEKEKEKAKEEKGEK